MRRAIRITILLLAFATPPSLVASNVAAQLSSGPAALLVFPYIAVDEARGTDTIVQLVNASDEALEVRCAYENYVPECTGAGSCVRDCTRGCVAVGIPCDGQCVERRVTMPFRLRLTANQPIGWNVADGLSQGMLDGNRGTRVPRAQRGGFQGTLRCAATDDRGRPIDRNALVGSASIETSAGGRVDAAQYNAFGLAAIAGANNGDEMLRLGGEEAEYAACPGSLVLPHVADFATLRTGVNAGTVATTIALVPCGGDMIGDDTSGVVAQMLVYNEYSQRLSTSRPIVGQLVIPLSNLDTPQNQRSIFSVGVLGTLTVQTNVESIGGGVLAVALEEHTEGDDSAPKHRAALPLEGEGAYASGEDVTFMQPPCQGDCSGDGRVAVEELVLGINVGLGTVPVDVCAAIDANGSGSATIEELTGAVGVALSACPTREVVATPTATPEIPVPTPTAPSDPGPAITYLGIASGDDAPQAPMGSDDEGRPIYAWPVGQGFTLIVEAAPGTSGRLIGSTATSADPEQLPDLQMIASRPLGDGNPTVCDADRPNLGGIPAVQPLEFGPAAETTHAINDLGCRADNGNGQPRSRPGINACTRLPPDNRVGFASGRGAQSQFCIPIAKAWAFPDGDTIVAARGRDVLGNVGPAREMVIRVAPVP